MLDLDADRPEMGYAMTQILPRFGTGRSPAGSEVREVL